MLDKWDRVDMWEKTKMRRRRRWWNRVDGIRSMDLEEFVPGGTLSSLAPPLALSLEIFSEFIDREIDEGSTIS